jgi:hypothetical protein
MEKLQHYPNYVSHYEYEGGTTIRYTRTNGNAVVYEDFLDLVQKKKLKNILKKNVKNNQAKTRRYQSWLESLMSLE